MQCYFWRAAAVLSAKGNDRREFVEGDYLILIKDNCRSLELHRNTIAEKIFIAPIIEPSPELFMKKLSEAWNNTVEPHSIIIKAHSSRGDNYMMKLTLMTTHSKYFYNDEDSRHLINGINIYEEGNIAVEAEGKAKTINVKTMLIELMRNTDFLLSSESGILFDNEEVIETYRNVWTPDKTRLLDFLVEIHNTEYNSKSILIIKIFDSVIRQEDIRNFENSRKALKDFFCDRWERNESKSTLKYGKRNNRRRLYTATFDTSEEYNVYGCILFAENCAGQGNLSILEEENLAGDMAFCSFNRLEIETKYKLYKTGAKKENDDIPF